MKDWMTIVHTLGDLLYLAAAVITLITILAERHHH